MNVITKFEASSYSGNFEYQEMRGAFNCTGDKTIQNINGTKEGVGSFDAYNMGSELNYNLHPTSLDKVSELATIVSNVVEAIKSELSE